MSPDVRMRGLKLDFDPNSIRSNRESKAKLDQVNETPFGMSFNKLHRIDTSGSIE